MKKLKKCSKLMMNKSMFIIKCNEKMTYDLIKNYRQLISIFFQ